MQKRRKCFLCLRLPPSPLTPPPHPASHEFVASAASSPTPPSLQIVAYPRCVVFLPGQMSDQYFLVLEGVIEVWAGEPPPPFGNGENTRDRLLFKFDGRRVFGHACPSPSTSRLSRRVGRRLCLHTQNALHARSSFLPLPALLSFFVPAFAQQAAPVGWRDVVVALQA